MGVPELSGGQNCYNFDEQIVRTGYAVKAIINMGTIIEITKYAHNPAGFICEIKRTSEFM